MRRATTIVLALLLGACSRETATEPVPPLVDAAWLRTHRDDVVLVDMQSSRELYEKGHVEGAVHAEVDDFRDEKKNLAPVAELERKLGELGVDRDTHVVAYDELYGRHAGWLWYVLHQLGHERVSLLDGGMDGIELVAGPPPGPASVRYEARKFPTDVVDAKWVEEHLGRAVFLDVRPDEQYTGKKPKEGMKPGHLPGAISVPWTAFRGPGNRYLDPAAAEKLLAGVPKDEEVVLYCNSYHQAAHVHFQLVRLGYRNLKAFDGSMKEWLEDPQRPLQTGREP